jgi:hypothetical protein
VDLSFIERNLSKVGKKQFRVQFDEYIVSQLIDQEMLKELNRSELLEIANSSPSKKNCLSCTPLVCNGWETVPGTFNLNSLRAIGTLRIDGAAECWDEDHPHGTNLWSENAPISIQYHPYNRSDVCECQECGRKYLRYTEYGGYYVDERIRALNPKLITKSNRIGDCARTTQNDSLELPNEIHPASFFFIQPLNPSCPNLHYRLRF